MKKLLLFSLSLLTLSACHQKNEKLLLGGSGWDKIVIIDKKSKTIEWEYPMEKGWECNSVAATPDGNILFSYSKGARLINRNKEELWNINAPEGCELQTARILPDGNYLLAWCGSPAGILEVGPDGRVLSETEFDTQIENPHSQFRQITKNQKGNYMIPLLGTSEICEVSPQGQQIKSVKVKGNPFCIAPLTNGNYLVACGDAHCYREVNFESGEVIRTVHQDDIQGAKLSFVAQLLPLPNGNTYICNWQGHSHDDTLATNPQLIEINAKGEMVWYLDDNATFGMISSISIVD